mgnify:CR=1 FL=1
MIKKAVVVLSLVSVLVLGLGVASAQQYGNRVCDPQQPEDCLSDPQLNAFQNGGIGFVNPETGSQWNGQQRGQMGRGTGLNGTGMYTSMPPASEGDLPQEVVDLMVDGWLDEQHAYAVYESVIAQFGEVAPFVSIQNAEAQHSAAWEFLFDRYGIETPEVPTFDVPEFATLADACSAAADAEIANFGLYDTMLDTFAEYPDLYQVALALRNASEFNHLPAFQACAS